MLVGNWSLSPAGETCAAGGNVPEIMPARTPGAHLPEFPARPGWVTADIAVLGRVRAALLGEREDSR